MKPTPAASPASSVSPVELFFDLVFVFTLTQLTSVLREDFSLSDAGRVLLLFWALWWMYGGYAWLTNHVPPRRPRQKLLLFAGMAGFLIAAVGVPGAFGESALVFGFGYLLVVCVHLVLFAQSDALAAVVRMAPFNLVSALLILGTAFADGALVYVLWVLALLVQVTSPRLLPRRSWESEGERFHLSPHHFVERHGLLVIVALGESVIAIGMGMEASRLTAGAVGVMVLALLLPAGLWWAYFTDAPPAEKAMESARVADRSRLALRGYFFAHMPMLLGIVAAAAGIHEAIAHPGEPADWAPATALAGGVALFLAGSAAFRHVLGLGSPMTRIAAAAAVLATVPLGWYSSAAAQLVAVVVLLVGMIAVEMRMGEHAIAEASHPQPATH